jgi:phosphatidylglycerophosphate synthase
MKLMFNIPNLLSLTRIIIFTPLIVYFVLQQNIPVVVILGILAIFTDVLDGVIARARKQESILGAILDSSADTFILAALAFPFAYLGLMSWPMIAFFAAHRFTRGFSSLYIGLYAKGIYNPRFMKITGYIPTIHILLIPVFVALLDQEFTDLATWVIFISTYIALVASIIYAIVQFKRGKLKLTHKA